MKYLAAQIEAESTYSLTRVLSSWGDSPLPPPWISHLNYNLYLYMYVNNKVYLKVKKCSECPTPKNSLTPVLLSMSIQKRSISLLLMSKHGDDILLMSKHRHNLSLYYWCQNTGIIYLFTIDVKAQKQSISLL